MILLSRRGTDVGCDYRRGLIHLPRLGRLSACAAPASRTGRPRTQTVRFGLFLADRWKRGFARPWAQAGWVTFVCPMSLEALLPPPSLSWGGVQLTAVWTTTAPGVRRRRPGVCCVDRRPPQPLLQRCSSSQPRQHTRDSPSRLVLPRRPGLSWVDTSFAALGARVPQRWWLLVGVTRWSPW